MITDKQKAVQTIKDQILSDPSLSIPELCKKQKISPSYYYSVSRGAKRKKVRSAKLEVPTTFRIESQKTSIPSGYSAILFVPTSEIIKIFGGVL